MGLGPALARGPRVSLGRVLLLLQGTTGTRALALPSQLEKKLQAWTLGPWMLDNSQGGWVQHVPTCLLPQALLE